MSERVEIIKEEIMAVIAVEEVATRLMDRVISFGRKKLPRPGEIEEVGELLGMEDEAVASVLVKFLYDRQKRHREVALLVLAHPEFDLYQALSLEKFIPLRDQVAERVFWMVKNDRDKWVTGWAGVLVGKLGVHPEYNNEAEEVIWAFQDRVKKLGWAKELKKNIPPLRGLPFFL